MATGQALDEETEALVERWILAFCEAPPLVDVELMERILSEHEASSQGIG
jgi:hypothetical protein